MSADFIEKVPVRLKVATIIRKTNNLFENNKIEFNKKKKTACAEICKQVSFIK